MYGCEEENSVPVMPSSAARCPGSSLHKLFSLRHSPASSGAGSTGILGPVLQPCSSAPLYLGGDSCRENVYSGGLGGLHCPCPTCDTSTSLVTLKGRELFLAEVVRKKTSPQLFSLLPGSRQAIVTGRTVPGVRSTGKVRDLPLHEFPGGLTGMPEEDHASVSCHAFPLERGVKPGEAIASMQAPKQTFPAGLCSAFQKRLKRQPFFP